jgi:hypothetical protein
LRIWSRARPRTGGLRRRKKVPKDDEREYFVDRTPSEDEPQSNGIWLLIAVVVALMVVMVGYGIYHSNEDADGLAQSQIAQFHGVLAERDYIRIYTEADSEFKQHNSQDAVVAELSNITNRLGAPASAKLISKHMERGDNGSYLHATFETSFTNEQRAKETITWHETDGIYRLFEYNIEPIGK